MSRIALVNDEVSSEQKLQLFQMPLDSGEPSPLTTYQPSDSNETVSFDLLTRLYSPHHSAPVASAFPQLRSDEAAQTE